MRFFDEPFLSSPVNDQKWSLPKIQNRVGKLIKLTNHEKTNDRHYGMLLRHRTIRTRH